MGRSYWHAPQSLGSQFESHKLAGYFNDMKAKTEWQGPRSEQGFPLVDAHGELILFPTTLFQKALGHWDQMLSREHQREHHENEFLKLALWALKTQDAHGGWTIWPLLHMSFPSLYSAMTQGEGISVLVRAYSLSCDVRFLRAAEEAVRPMLIEVSEGGVARKVPEGVILEEFPRLQTDGVLNGWIFALFGLRDLLMVTDHPDARMMLKESISTLVKLLPKYEMSYWSYYDLTGKVASPFYHQLHIAQLSALELSFPEHEANFRRARLLFESYASSTPNKTRAMVVKLYQKLIKPPAVVVH